jgi:hypothetical protein
VGPDEVIEDGKQPYAIARRDGQPMWTMAISQQGQST